MRWHLTSALTTLQLGPPLIFRDNRSPPSVRRCANGRDDISVLCSSVPPRPRLSRQRTWKPAVRTLHVVLCMVVGKRSTALREPVVEPAVEPVAKPRTVGSGNPSPATLCFTRDALAMAVSETKQASFLAFLSASYEPSPCQSLLPLTRMSG